MYSYSFLDISDLKSTGIGGLRLFFMAAMRYRCGAAIRLNMEDSEELAAYFPPFRLRSVLHNWAVRD